MQALTKIINTEEALSRSEKSVTAVMQTPLHRRCDYELVIFELAANESQNPHYHIFGEIDIFMVTAGSGRLDLAKVEDGKVVKGSEQSYELKAGDTYCVGLYTLHSIHAGADGIRVMNIAQPAHSAVKGADVSRATDIHFVKD